MISAGPSVSCGLVEGEGPAVVRPGIRGASIVADSARATLKSTERLSRERKCRHDGVVGTRLRIKVGAAAYLFVNRDGSGSGRKVKHV